jgi:hypothetical protein
MVISSVGLETKNTLLARTNINLAPSNLDVGQSQISKNVRTKAQIIVGIRHQATISEDSRMRRISTCCSELQSV